VLSGRGLCDELITRPEKSYRLWCVVVCNLETSRICAPYIYDFSSLRVKWIWSLITWRRFAWRTKLLTVMHKFDGCVKHLCEPKGNISSILLQYDNEKIKLIEIHYHHQQHIACRGLGLVSCSSLIKGLQVFSGVVLASFPTRLIFHNQVWQSVCLSVHSPNKLCQFVSVILNFLLQLG